jgi:hypothetical protein
MSKQVSVNLPAAGEGTMLEVQGLGVFENGTTTDVDDEQVTVYTEAFGYEWPEGQDTLNVVPAEPEPEVVAAEDAPVVSDQSPPSEPATTEVPSA